MQKGTVKFFDTRDDKLFGFVRTEQGEEFFFHFSGGRELDTYDEQPDFSRRRLDRSRFPKKGDQMVFILGDPGYKGERVGLWSFAEDYDQIQKELAARPTYRVMKQFGMWTTKHQDEPEILWEGKDVQELARKYHRFGRSITSDPLFPYYQHDDGFEVRHWFEKQKEDGTWERCNDPRPSSR
jgi:hypothetical protein